MGGENASVSLDYIASTGSDLNKSVHQNAVANIFGSLFLIAIVAGVLIFVLRRSKKQTPTPKRPPMLSPTEEADMALILDDKLKSYNASGRSDAGLYREITDMLAKLPMYVPCEQYYGAVPQGGAFRFKPLFYNGVDCAAVFTSHDKVPPECAVCTRRLYPHEYIRAAAALGKSILIDPGFETELWLPRESIINAVAPKVV